jgi:hypothetical protein
MKNLNNIMLVITFIGIVMLAFKMEKQNAQKEAYFNHFDSVITRVDSLLVQAEQRVKWTDSVTNLLREYNESHSAK